ncbi:hypothetical protein, partial [Streptomyces shaanxiensis]|uniref:hypothetical protein n=1 Tax=Streptomyces shaanxiensis TaxID=653357 RepID=UPI0031E98F65
YVRARVVHLRCPCPGRRVLADQQARADGEFAFGPSITRVPPAQLGDLVPGSFSTGRQLAAPFHKKFLSESLTHHEAPRSLCQQALT